MLLPHYTCACWYMYNCNETMPSCLSCLAGFDLLNIIVSSVSQQSKANVSHN